MSIVTDIIASMSPPPFAGIAPPLPNSRAHLLATTGQSNALGYAMISLAKQAGIPFGRFRSLQIWNPDTEGFEDLYIPPRRGDYADANNRTREGTFGVELGLALLAQEAGETIFMVKHGIGGTHTGLHLPASRLIAPINPDDCLNPLDDGCFPPHAPARPGEIDAELWRQMQAARAVLTARFGEDGVHTRMFVAQGENDATSSVQLPRFARRKRTFIDVWRERLGADLRIVHSAILARSQPSSEVNFALAEIARTDPLFTFLGEAAYYQSKRQDDVHFGYEAMIQLAALIYRELARDPAPAAIANDTSVRTVTVKGLTLHLLDTDSDVAPVRDDFEPVLSRTRLSDATDGRKLIMRNLDMRSLIIRHDHAGDRDQFAPFMLRAQRAREIVRGGHIKFVARGGVWYERETADV